jgi:hypothetical protein
MKYDTETARDLAAKFLHSFPDKDLSSARDRAHKALEELINHIGYIVDYRGEDGKTHKITEPLRTTFDLLEQFFIAPQTEIDPEKARLGYFLLMALGQFFILGTYAKADVYHREKHRAPAAAGGIKNGARLKANAEKWRAEALPIARRYAAAYPSYSQDDLASHIEHMLDPPVQHAQIKSVISSWQKGGSLPKRQVKRASLSR